MNNHKTIEVSEKNEKLYLNLYIERASIFVVLFMGFFALLGLLIPIATFIISKNLGLQPGAGFIISIIIGFGVAFYLTRILLWNTLGVERYVISSGSVKQVCDYKLFSDSERILEDSKIVPKFTIRNLGSKAPETGRLTFVAPGDSIQSVVDLPANAIDELLNRIEGKLNNNSLNP